MIEVVAHCIPARHQPAERILSTDNAPVPQTRWHRPLAERRLPGGTHYACGWKPDPSWGVWQHVFAEIPEPRCHRCWP